MTDGHCFISYSGADGLTFANRLADELQGHHPNYKIWFDKRELSSTSPEDWDDQLANAIKTCKCLIFVMTEDSTAAGSVCKDEWTWALKYKKPVIALRKEAKAEVPFRLNNRQHVDFTKDFDIGISQLRIALARLDSPEGALDELKQRLADANRDFRRTKPEEQPRILAEIEELKSQIQVQQKAVDNPQAAAEQTQKNIKSGLAREQKSEGDTRKETFTKFINPPPGIAPTYFQDRNYETEQIAAFLNDAAQRLMTIIGRGGVGKTATICRLLKDLERGVLPDDLGEMQVDGIVYLSEVGRHKINFANIFYDLSKLLPADAVQKLDSVYKNPQGSTESKMQTLLDNFQGKPVILLLDNFETLIEEKEELPIRDAELDEALHSLLNGVHTAVKIIITTRIPPETLNGIQPGRQRVHHLESGLAPKYAKEMLLQMDKDGIYGFKSANPSVFDAIYEHTRGLPKALEALIQILASDRYTTLEELLAMPTPVNVVEALVGEAFNRLDTNAQKVMQALAVYNRPVTPAAVDYLLAPYIPAMDSSPILQRLANMHFARKESGRFYLHPVDREFAFGLIPVEDLTTTPEERGQADTRVTKEEEGAKVSDIPDVSDVIKVNPEDVVTSSETKDENAELERIQKELEALISGMKELEEKEISAFTQHSLLKRAANYYKQARKPRAEWKKLDDLSAQLAEFDLRCAAGDYDTAADVLTDIDFDYLFLWGHYRLLISMHDSLQGKITDKELNRICTGNLGSANIYTGQVLTAIKYLEKLLTLAREDKSKQHECAALNNLGTAYSALGDIHRAIELHEQALVVAQAIGDRKSEGNALGNLGGMYDALGDLVKAIDYDEQALAIHRELGNKLGEGNSLGRLGNYYAELGDAIKAIEFSNKSLLVKREIGDRSGESIRHENIGHSWLSLGEYQHAEENYKQAIQIADEISFSIVQNYARWGMAEAYLFQNDLVNARATIEAALQYDVPENNHNASALHGIIALRQGDEVAARGAFLRAIGQADEILSKTAEYYSALDAKGLALCGSTLCRSRLQRDTGDFEESSRSKRDLQDAIETFHKARKIAPHAGVVKSVLRLFDELAKCDTEGLLKDVRKAVEGKE